MLPYIFHVSILIATCYLFYRILWEKETFFQLNRWILITCLLLSFGLPWLSIPQSWSLQNKVVQQEVSTTNMTAVLTDNNATATSNAIESIAETTLENNKEATIRATDISTPIATKKMVEPSSQWAFNVDIWTILQYTYLAGLIIFVLNFLIQLALIFFQKNTNPTLQDGRYTIVELNQNKAPFSFGNSIFINPTMYDWDTYNQILDHEKIHIQERHTIDILLAELVVIFQWFNPFAWLYRKAVENNLEYLTDYKMLHQGTERATYQLNLLRVSVPQLPLNLTTNYNQSFLKKRIAMMNVKKSSASSSWKYLMLFPLLALTVIALNPVHLDAQNDPKSTTKTKEDKDKSTFWGWDSTPPPPPPPPPAPPAPPVHDVPAAPPPPPPAPPAPPTPPTPNEEGVSRTVTIGSWTTNEAGHSSKGSLHMTESTSGESGTSELQLSINGSAEFVDDNLIIYSGEMSIDGKALNIPPSGNWVGGLENDNVCIQFIHQRKHKKYALHLKNCFPPNQFGSMPANNSKGTISIIEEAGKLDITGKFNTKEGSGNYAFYASTDFRSYLKQEGFDEIDNLLFSLFLAEIDKDYLGYLKREGYKNISDQELEILAHHQIAKEELKGYIDGFKKMRLDRPKLKDLSEFIIHEVAMEYIEEMGADLYQDFTVKEVIEAAMHDINPKDIKKIKDLGFDDLSYRDLLEFSNHGIDADYIKTVRNSGIDFSKRDIIHAATQGVDADYITQISHIGMEDISMRDIALFATQGVEVDFIRDLKNSGLKLSKRDITEAATTGIDGDYVMEIAQIGMEDISMRDIINFHHHGIDTDFIRDLKNSGLDLSKRDIIDAANLGIEADYITQITQLGFKDLSMRDITNFHNHGIDIDFIRDLKNSGMNFSNRDISDAALKDIDPEEIEDLKQLGFKNITMRQLTKLKTHDVTASFIKQNQTRGWDLNDYIDFKLTGKSNNQKRQE